MVNPFDNNANPFDRGTGGDPQGNWRKGKTAEELAEEEIRRRGQKPVLWHEGADFKVIPSGSPDDTRALYFVEVKSGNATLTEVQRRFRAQLPSDIGYEVMRFDNPPWY